MTHKKDKNKYAVITGEMTEHNICPFTHDSRPEEFRFVTLLTNRHLTKCTF